MTNPKLIVTPFADIGAKNDIPDSGATEPQLATMSAGFPAITQTPINEGGKPPERADFNGLGYLTTSHLAFLNRGQWYGFDPVFAGQIGGYPLHARLQLDNGDIAQSTIPNNTNNPNINPMGWIVGLPARLVSDESGLTQQQWNDGIDSILDLSTIPSPKNGSRVFVKSIQKCYSYNTELLLPSNGVTVVDKWEMDTQETYLASWFATPDVQSNQATLLQTGYDYAVSKKRPFIVDGHFYVDGDEIGNEKVAFYVRSNSTIIFKKGIGKFEQIATNTQGYDVIRIHEGVENVAIFDPVIIGDRDTHTGTLGEWGYLLTLYDCENIYIKSPILNNAWGDGLHIGRRYSYPEAKMPKNIIIEDMSVDRARRNGFSLTGGENISIVRPIISRTNGIAPQAGIDIEPEEAPNAELSYLKNIRIIDATLIDNKEHFNILCNKKDRHIDVVFSGATRFINNGLYSDKFSIYKYTNVIGDKQSGQIIFDNILWTTVNSNIEISLSSEDTGVDIVFNRLEFNDTPTDINIFYIADSIVENMPWGGIDFRNITGAGLSAAAQSSFFISSNRDLLKTGIVLNLPDNVDWVVNSPLQLVDSNEKNINTACTRFGSVSTPTNKLSTYIRYVSHVDLSQPIYLTTSTDYRRLKIEFSKDIDVIGFGLNINGLLILDADGNNKTEAHCKTPSGWIEFQNIEGGRTKIIDYSGVWTFS